MFDRFPEILMIDATHGTNSSKYKVFSIMAHDVFGKGQFVQHAVVQNERRPSLLTALEEFKKHNPAWTKIQCIFIDKDFTEMSVLKTVFPDVTVLLCQFHAIKYLREKIASTDYTFSAWQKLQLQGIANLMVYAQTEREYMKHRRYLTHIVSIEMRGDLEFPSLPSSQLGLELDLELGSELGLELGSELGAGLQSRFGGDYSSTQCGGDYSELGIEPSQAGSVRLTHEFDKYITKNWDNCRHMWCAYKRQNAVTLGNNTNNRIEASWKQLKDLVDSFMGVDECIASIMYHQTREEKLFNDRVYKLTVVQNANYDREMALLANLVSEHACELIHDQYTYAVGRATYTYYEPVPEVYMIQNGDTAINALDEPRAEYSVTKRNWECSCLFMTTRLLPCRHVFFIRKALGFDTIIPTQLLSSRWLLSSIRAGTPLDEFTSGSFAMGKIIREGDTAWDSNRKYREARAVATSISENMSGLGMAEYRVAMDALQLVAKLFKRGKFDVILRADGFQTSENDTLQVQDDTASLAPDAVSMDADGRVLGPPSDNIDDPTPLNDPTELPLDGPACSPTLELGSPAPELGARDSELGEQVDQAPPTPRLVEIGNDEDFDL
ncbi:hypothetical protein BBJ28_00017783 [Nothophytophthora sp. Chile5]|nr:hypothetical protein BBJ28_00017783 [Nothophytophthora sp. Chile5]